MESNDWLIRGIPKEQLEKERREAIQEVEKALKKQELRPCPFCGSAAEYGECATDYPTEHKNCLVRCSNPSCRARIERNTRVEDHDTKWIVVGLWNRRAENGKK